MLGEVVAAHRKALGVAVPDVDHAGGWGVGGDRGVCGRGRVRLRVSHREASLFQIGQALVRIAVLSGAECVYEVVGADRTAAVRFPDDLSPERVRTGIGWVGSHPVLFLWVTRATETRRGAPR